MHIYILCIIVLNDECLHMYALLPVVHMVMYAYVFLTCMHMYFLQPSTCMYLPHTTAAAAVIQANAPAASNIFFVLHPLHSYSHYSKQFQHGTNMRRNTLLRCGHDICSCSSEDTDQSPTLEVDPVQTLMRHQIYFSICMMEVL